MTRLHKLDVAGLDDDQRRLYDEIAGGPRAHGRQLIPLVDHAGRLEGPFNAMLLQPRLGAALQGLGSVLRYGCSLTDRAREVAILLVGHAEDSPFEVYAHEAVGRAAGLDDAELAALRDGRVDDLRGEDERAVARVTATLLARRDLTDLEYTSARTLLSEPALFELTTLIGYYTTLALQLRVFDVELPTESA